MQKARAEAHILIGLRVAINAIDELIQIIRSSKTVKEAEIRLLERTWDAKDVIPLIEIVSDNNNKIIGDKCYLTSLQVKAILDMRLAKLTGLEKEKLENNLQELGRDIKNYLEILANRELILNIIKKELTQIGEEFATPRKTDIQLDEEETDIEDLIPKEEMVVIVTLDDYIKRVPVSHYRSQKRGGKGKSGIKLREDELVKDLFISSTHDHILFFTNIGKVYRLKAFEIPLASSSAARGRAIVNLITLDENEKIAKIMVLSHEHEVDSDLGVIFATRAGKIRLSYMQDFTYIPANGKIAISLEEGDLLVGVSLARSNDSIILASELGQAARIALRNIRFIKSRKSSGVIGMKLAQDDHVISLEVVEGIDTDFEKQQQFIEIPLSIRKKITEADRPEQLVEVTEGLKTELSPEELKYLADHERFLLTITENGYGKRTSIYSYKPLNRGAKGVINIKTSKRNGNACFSILSKL